MEKYVKNIEFKIKYNVYQYNQTYVSETSIYTLVIFAILMFILGINILYRKGDSILGWFFIFAGIISYFGFHVYISTKTYQITFTMEDAKHYFTEEVLFYLNKYYIKNKEKKFEFYLQSSLNIEKLTSTYITKHLLTEIEDYILEDKKTKEQEEERTRVVS